MLSPGDAFGPRYRILRMLGAGGMGIVYHAWDEELGVAVALKIIRPEVSADPVSAKELEKRFKRELLLARQVTHHNVVRIHDIGEVEGTKYITMSFIDGRDLASELKGSGHLPIPRALHILRELAEGLRAAHNAGVIHRDLKPANIMIEGDTPIIMDFGIARSAVQPVEGKGMIGSTRLSRSALVTGATMQGAIVGTVAYMSPEQAKGQPADQRSDIYAVGMIMRDMLVGMRNVENPTDAMNELMARIGHAPKPVQEIDPSIPDDVDRIVTRCLQPDAAARYQNVQELLADLNSLDAEGKPLPKIRRLTKRVVGTAAVIVLTLLGTTWWFASRPPPPAPDPMSVLIADFENRTGDPVFEGSLEQLLSMGVEGATFINAYRRDDARKLAAAQIGPGAKLDENAARLVSMREGIEVILAGSIAPRGSGYTLSVKAVDPANGNVLGTASQRADTKANVPGAIGALASEVRGLLGDTTSESARLAAAETVTSASLEAIRDYSRAQDLLYNSRDEEAIGYYKRAIEKDPNLGRAYSGWAISAGNLGRREEAAEAWKRALSLSDRMTDREKYRTLGIYYIRMAQNYDKAIENFSTLIRLYPSDRGGHVNLALAYFYTRNFSKALEEGRRSVEVGSKDLMNRTNYALYAMYAGDFKTAATEAQKVIAQDPAVYRAYFPLAIAALASGDAAMARSAYERMAKSGTAGASLAGLGLADIALYQGRFAEAETILRTGIAEDAKTNNTAGMAAKYVALGEAQIGLDKGRAAATAAERALKILGRQSMAVPAAKTLLLAGNEAEPRALAVELGNQLQAEARAHAKLLEGDIALEAGRTIEAVEAFKSALKLVDLWWARLALGIAYVNAGHHAEALGELELCQKRRGEATAIFLDDVPSFRYLATLPYWLARAQEGAGQTAAAKGNYTTYLNLRSDTPRDPLAIDAQKRLTAR
jgi:eukaryotic-like serine/threonine-protein kinase